MKKVPRRINCVRFLEPLIYRCDACGSQIVAFGAEVWVFVDVDGELLGGVKNCGRVECVEFNIKKQVPIGFKTSHEAEAVKARVRQTGLVVGELLIAPKPANVISLGSRRRLL